MRSLEEIAAAKKELESVTKQSNQNSHYLWVEEKLVRCIECLEGKTNVCPLQFGDYLLLTDKVKKELPFELPMPKRKNEGHHIIAINLSKDLVKIHPDFNKGEEPIRTVEQWWPVDTRDITVSQALEMRIAWLERHLKSLDSSTGFYV